MILVVMFHFGGGSNWHMILVVMFHFEVATGNDSCCYVSFWGGSNCHMILVVMFHLGEVATGT